MKWQLSLIWFFIICMLFCAAVRSALPNIARTSASAKRAEACVITEAIHTADNFAAIDRLVPLLQLSIQTRVSNRPQFWLSICRFWDFRTKDEVRWAGTDGIEFVTHWYASNYTYSQLSNKFAGIDMRRTIINKDDLDKVVYFIYVKSLDKYAELAGVMIFLAFLFASLAILTFLNWLLCRHIYHSPILD